MPETTSAAPTRSVGLIVSSKNSAPKRTETSGTKNTKAATRLASPALTSLSQSTHASAVPINAVYSKLATKDQFHEMAEKGSSTSPNPVRSTPPIENGIATAHRVESLSPYFLKYTVPKAHPSAEIAPNATPEGLPKPAP